MNPPARLRFGADEMVFRNQFDRHMVFETS